MPLSEGNANSTRENRNARMDETFRIIAVSATLFDPAAAEVFFKLPDEELGRLVKASLMRVVGLATLLDLDVGSGRAQPGGKIRGTESRQNRRATSRRTLVAEGRLLRVEDVCRVFNITKKRFHQDVARGRLFIIDIESDEYVPAFFLARELDRKNLSKIVRRLGSLNSWSKWDFFTTPVRSLGNLTPLQACYRGEVKQVLQLAAGNAEQ